MNPKNDEKKQRIYRYIKEYIDDKTYPPTITDVARTFGCSLSTAHKYVQRLIDEGTLTRVGKERMILNEENKVEKMLSIPILGEIACGVPMLAQEDILGYIPLGKSCLGPGDYFALKAKGDSMIEADIDSGDIVIIKQQNTADNGQIVVAAVIDEFTNEYDATLKRFYLDKKNRKIHLKPENSTMSEIVVDDARILGVAKMIIKKLD